VAPGVPSAQDVAAGAFLESLTQDVFAKLTDPSLSHNVPFKVKLSKQRRSKKCRNEFPSNQNAPTTTPTNKSMLQGAGL